MFIVYDIIFLIFAMACLPYLILKGKWHAGFWTRFGFSMRKDVADNKTIWVHAVSVGEVEASLPLIKRIKESQEHYFLILCGKTGK